MGVQQFLFEPREHSELEATGQWWSGSDWCPSAASRAPAACDSVDEVALLLGPQDATVKAYGVRLRNVILNAIDEAFGDAPVATPYVRTRRPRRGHPPLSGPRRTGATTRSRLQRPSPALSSSRSLEPSARSWLSKAGACTTRPRAAQPVVALPSQCS